MEQPPRLPQGQHKCRISASMDCVPQRRSATAAGPKSSMGVIISSSSSIGGSNVNNHHNNSNSKSRSLRTIVQRITPRGDAHYVQLLKQFCDCTSAHGFHKLFASTSRLHRALWLLIITTALTGFTVHLSFLGSRFLQSPVNTETRVYSTPFVFPDVTVCSTGHFSRLRYERNPRVPSVNASLQDLIASIRRFWGPDDPGVNADLRNSLRSFLHEVNVTRQPQEAVIHCQYAGGRCSYRDFVESVDPEYFSCFTFAPANRQLIVGGEKDGGLSLILYTGDNKNFITEEESLSFSSGYRVVVHPPDTRPDSADGFYIQNGSSTHLQLAYTSVSVLSKEARRCAQQDQLPSVHFLDIYGRLRSYQYSVKDCTMRLCQEYLNTTCQCLSELLPIPANYGPDFRDKFCHQCQNTTGDTASWTGQQQLQRRRECHDRELELVHRRIAVDLDACPVPCAGRQYDMRLTQSSWPGHPGEAGQALLERVRDSLRMAAEDGLDLRVLQQAEDGLARGGRSAVAAFARLTVYSHSTMGGRVAEAWAYPAGNLFSDVGGILGLWLGVSLISTFEFFELFVHLAASARRERRRRRRRKKRQSQEGSMPLGAMAL